MLFGSINIIIIGSVTFKIFIFIILFLLIILIFLIKYGHIIDLTVYVVYLGFCKILHEFLLTKHQYAEIFNVLELLFLHDIEDLFNYFGTCDKYTLWDQTKRIPFFMTFLLILRFLKSSKEKASG